MITVEDLRALPMFGGVSEEQLDDLIELGEETPFRAGEVLWTQDGPADCWWVLLEGRIDLVRTVGHEETLLGAMDAPGRWAGGFRAWDEQAVYLATGRGAAAGRVMRVESGRLKGWTGARDPFSAHLVEGVFRTARTVETAARQRDALVALGTLAAGLAHELNNPAAAATRAVDSLREASLRLFDTLGRFAAAGSVTAEQFLALDALRRELVRAPAGPVDPMVMADREDALSDWLVDHDVDDDWSVASALAAAGADVEWCRRAADALGESLSAGLAWVVSTVTVASLLDVVTESTRRISDLVGAVRSYSQLDRAALQRTDLREGLESTMAVLGHVIPDDVTVVREYAPDTPVIEAIPAELNQVWTNLITNAVDAMGGVGRLRLATRPDRDGVTVEIGDSGTWNDPGAKDRAFEPFFTTKGVGQGTGLGLDISRRIVVGRHRGDITIDLRPGETVLRVWLPLQPAQDAS